MRVCVNVCACVYECGCGILTMCANVSVRVCGCVSILCICMEANIRVNMRREKVRVFICRAGEVGGAQGR